MRFQPLSPAVVPADKLTADFSAAPAVGKVRLGQEQLYFTKFSSTAYLPYSEIVRAYLRQEEVTAKMCCGRANFDRFFVMAEGQDGTLHKLEVATRQAGDQILAHISSRNPSVELGYRKPQTA